MLRPMSRLSTFISQRIDRILTRIVEGEAGTAVPQLAGILDAAGLASARTADLQQCLQCHPLAGGLALPAARAAIARLDPIRAIAGRSAGGRWRHGRQLVTTLRAGGVTSPPLRRRRANGRGSG